MSSPPAPRPHSDPNRVVLLVAVALSAFSVGLSSVLVGWTAWTKETSASIAALSEARPTASKRAGTREGCAILAARSN